MASYLRLSAAAFFFFINHFAIAEYGYEKKATTGPSSMADLQRLFEKKQPLSVEEFLERLPVELRKNPTFVYRSQSLQGASMQAPRVLLSEPDGNLVLAFNGDPKQHGYQQIEAMDFNETTKKFNFYEITFDNPQRTMKVSDANPSKCLSCHRASDPRPNWESYDRWPGVYASNDDRLTDEEFPSFKKFLQSFNESARYSSLQIPQLQSILKYDSYNGRLPNEPNITFTHTLSRNNFKRVARLITETKDYANYKYSIAATLGCYKGGLSEVMDAFSPPMAKKVLAYYSKEQVKEAQAIKNSVGDEYSYPSTLLFRSAFESRGIDVSDWFMNFKGGLNNTFLNGVSWQGQLLDALLDHDESLKDYLMPNSTFQLDCGKLSDKIDTIMDQKKIILSSESMLQFDNDPSVADNIWKRSCLQCHGVEGSKNAPLMSFSEALSQPNFKTLIESGAMPKNQTLTPSEKRRLIQAVNN